MASAKGLEQPDGLWRKTYRHLVGVPVAELAQRAAEKATSVDLSGKGLPLGEFRVTSEVVACHHLGTVVAWEIMVTAERGDNADAPVVVEGKP
jgi:hypothetical protein